MKLLRGGHNAIRHKVAASENSSWALGFWTHEKGLSATAPPCGHKITFLDQRFVRFHSNLSQRIKVSLVTVMRDFILHRALNIGDTLVPELDEIASGLVSPCAIIRTNPRNAFQWRILIIYQDHGKAMLVKFRQVACRLTRENRQETRS